MCKLLLIFTLCLIAVIRSEHIDTADKLVQDLRKAVELQLITALPLLEDYYNNIQTTSNLLIGTAEIDEGKEVNAVRLQIEDLVAEAKTLGNIDMDLLQTCINSYDGYLDVVHDFVLMAIKICVQTTEKEGLSIINTTKDTFEEIENKVHLLQLRVEECKLADIVDDCILEVIPILTNAISTLPPKIKEDTDKAEELILALLSTLGSCLANRKGIIISNGQGILKNIRTCSKMPVS